MKFTDMLNKYKIRTKLSSSGFIIILVLLLLVTVTSWLGMKTGNSNLKEVISTEELQANVLQMQQLVLNAVVTTLKADISRNLNYEQERKKYHSQITKIPFSVFHVFSLILFTFSFYYGTSVCNMLIVDISTEIPISKLIYVAHGSIGRKKETPKTI
jgi:uncharacterized membrane protein